MKRSNLLYVAPFLAALACTDKYPADDSGVFECVPVDGFGEQLMAAVEALGDPVVCEDMAENKEDCEDALVETYVLMETYLRVLKGETCVPVHFTQETGSDHLVVSTINITGENAQFTLESGGDWAAVTWNDVDGRNQWVEIGHGGNSSEVVVETTENAWGPVQSVYDGSIDDAQAAILAAYGLGYDATAGLDRGDFAFQVEAL